ncbi:MAG: hypothetical protein H6704_03105 [Myxococcales bacterium]|nr:hypothetical protein [Myxococcales bacterium]
MGGGARVGGHLDGAAVGVEGDRRARRLGGEGREGVVGIAQRRAHAREGVAGRALPAQLAGQGGLAAGGLAIVHGAEVRGQAEVEGVGELDGGLGAPGQLVLGGLPAVDVQHQPIAQPGAAARHQAQARQRAPADARGRVLEAVGRAGGGEAAGL